MHNTDAMTRTNSSRMPIVDGLFRYLLGVSCRNLSHL